MISLYKNDLPDDFSVMGGSIAVDTEAMGLDIFHHRLCLVQLSCGDGNAHLIQISKDICAPNLSRILQDESITKIFHFARFDVALLNYSLKINVRNIYCTKIASKFARTFTERHGLKNLCRDLLGKEISKNEQTSDWGSETLTQKQLHYAANDVLYLHQIRDILDGMLMRECKLDQVHRAFDALQYICELDIHGVSHEYIFNH